MNTSSKIEESLIRLVIVSGIFLLAIQYLFNRSLTIDEASIALSIIHRNIIELLKPLDFNQVAPILFLQITKFFSSIFPNIELGLRFISVLSYLFVMYFLPMLLKKLFGNSYTVLFTTSLFIFNIVMIQYSSELKQYMTDVFVILIMYYLLLKNYKWETNRFYILGISGAIGLFLSNVAVIILFSVGVYLLYHFFFIEKKHFKPLMGVLILWSLTFLIYYTLFIHHHPAKNHMLSWWSARHGFMPANPFSMEFYQFILLIIKMVFGSLLSVGNFGLFVLFPFYLTGICVLIYKKKTGVLILTMLPGILHAGLSGLHLYPFALRLVLYLSVPTIIVVGYGFEYFFFQFFKMLKIDHWQPIAIIFSVIPVLLFFQNPFPIKLNEIKNSINYIEKHGDTGQTIIVDGRAGRAFKFYQDINFITTRLPIKFEKPLNQADSAAIKKFVAQSGKNWILFTGGDQSGNRKFLKEIEELGCKRLDKFITSGSMAFLYDFGK